MASPLMQFFLILKPGSGVQEEKIPIYTRIIDFLQIEIYRVFNICHGSVYCSYTTWKSVLYVRFALQRWKRIASTIGTSVLLKFANASELERYLIEIYLQKSSAFYQEQFVNIKKSEEVSLKILKTYMKSVKNLYKRERHKR